MRYNFRFRYPRRTFESTFEKLRHHIFHRRNFENESS
eukprot:UN22306